MGVIPAVPSDRVVYDIQDLYIKRDLDIFTLDGSEIRVNGYPITLIDLDGQHGDILVENTGSEWRLNKLCEAAYVVQNGSSNYTVQVGDKVSWFDEEGRFFVGKNLLAEAESNSHSRLPDFMFDPIGMRFFTRSMSLGTLNDPADINYRRWGGNAPYGNGALDGNFDMLTGLGIGSLVGQLRATPSSVPNGGTEATPGGDAVSTGAVMSFVCSDMPRRVTSDGQTSNAMAQEFNLCPRNAHDFRETVGRISSKGNWQFGKQAVNAGDQGDIVQIKAYAGLNNKQLITITNSPTNGTFTIKYYSLPLTDTGFSTEATTAGIARNASLVAIQNALVAAIAAIPGLIGTTANLYSAVTAADILVTGGPLPDTPVQIEFTGLLGLMPQFRMLGTNVNMTGPGAAPTISITRVGQAGIDHEKGKRLLDMQHVAGQTADYFRVRDSAGVNALTLDVNKKLILGSTVRYTEMAAPTAPPVNTVEVYAEDNGAGKTRLMALFNTGAAQQLAIQP